MTSLRFSTHHHRLSPILVAGLAFLIALFVAASLAAAHVVQVTTTIDIADVQSPHEFERALQAAVEAGKEMLEALGQGADDAPDEVGVRPTKIDI